MSTTLFAVGIGVLVGGFVFQFGIFSLAMRKGINLGQAPGQGHAPGWQVRCPVCGFTVDASKAGLIRVKARGNSRNYAHCSGCNKKRWLVVEPTSFPDQPPGEGYAPGWQIRCPVCGHTADAGKAGLIRGPTESSSRCYGPCSACKKEHWLIVEPTSSLEKEKAGQETS